MDETVLCLDGSIASHILTSKCLLNITLMTRNSIENKSKISYSWERLVFLIMPIISHHCHVKEVIIYDIIDDVEKCDSLTQ